MVDVLTSAFSTITEDPAGALRVDLVLVARARTRQLGPLRRWARERLAADLARPSIVTITPEAMPWLAVLCETDPRDMASLLRPFTA